MLNSLKIKIHKLLLGKPPKPKFTNPYLQSELQKLPTYGIKPPAPKPRKALSFPFLSEMKIVMGEDKNRFKDWVLMKPRAIAAKIEKKKSLAEEYAAFEELVYRGMR